MVKGSYKLLIKLPSLRTTEDYYWIQNTEYWILQGLVYDIYMLMLTVIMNRFQYSVSIHENEYEYMTARR